MIRVLSRGSNSVIVTCCYHGVIVAERVGVLLVVGVGVSVISSDGVMVGVRVNVSEGIGLWVWVGVAEGVGLSVLVELG